MVEHRPVAGEQKKKGAASDERRGRHGFSHRGGEKVVKEGGCQVKARKKK